MDQCSGPKYYIVVVVFNIENEHRQAQKMVSERAMPSTCYVLQMSSYFVIVVDTMILCREALGVFYLRCY